MHSGLSMLHLFIFFIGGGMHFGGTMKNFKNIWNPPKNVSNFEYILWKHNRFPKHFKQQPIDYPTYISRSIKNKIKRLSLFSHFHFEMINK